MTGNINSAGWFLGVLLLVWFLEQHAGIRKITVYEVSCSAHGVEVGLCKKPNYLSPHEIEMLILLREQKVVNPEHSPSFNYRCEVIDEDNWWCASNQEPPNVIRMSSGRYTNAEIDFREDSKIMRYTDTGLAGWLYQLYYRALKFQLLANKIFTNMHLG